MKEVAGLRKEKFMNYLRVHDGEERAERDNFHKLDT